MLSMVWRDCCFAHWRADPERLARALPKGVTLERYAGEAWLSVVPFRLTRVRARFAPVLPGFGDVAEINLRTYVRVGSLRGIWFFSLDADSGLLVESARWTTSLPYFAARISVSEADGVISYRSERHDRRSGPGRFRARYRVPAAGQAAQPGSLAEFLHERYRFFALRRGRFVTGEVRHGAWMLGETAIDVEENTLGERIAHPLSGRPDLTFFAREQVVRAKNVRRMLHT
jgi:uncharacterized protein YqjF (DUF2071 family)